jgi:hypothetical protein
LIPPEEGAIGDDMAERVNPVENEIRIARVSDSDGIRSTLVPIRLRRAEAHHMDSDVPT